MKINIVSKDERYRLVKEQLCDKGLFSQICTKESVDECDFLLLSVKDEFSEGELIEILSKINKETVVLCGDNKKIDKLFNGKIIDYSKGDFVIKNAYLTAEAAVSFLHSITKDTVRGKKVFISGYGRIGKELSKILKALGSRVFVYARRKETRSEISDDGMEYSPLEGCIECDIIINTVPCVIYPIALINRIPKKALIVELASQPYGFENMERVILASALPGKILPVGAASVVFDTIYNVLSETEEEAL